MQDQLQKEYERGFIDGMQKQMQSSVDKAVNKMAQSGEEMVPLKAYKELSALCTRQGIRLMEYESQSEQNPVAWLYTNKLGGRQVSLIEPPSTLAMGHYGLKEQWQPLYTATPQREWQGLTDEEVEKIYLGFDSGEGIS